MTEPTTDTVRIYHDGLMNGWTTPIDEAISYHVAKAGGITTVTFEGLMIPSVDSFDRPAFVVREDARPREQINFGLLCTVYADGRFVPHGKNAIGGFTLDEYRYTIEPIVHDALTEVLAELSRHTAEVREQGPPPLLTRTERAIAWAIFWPEFVWRCALGVWDYLRALHSLWQREALDGTEDDDE